MASGSHVVMFDDWVDNWQGDAFRQEWSRTKKWNCQGPPPVYVAPNAGGMDNMEYTRCGQVWKSNNNKNAALYLSQQFCLQQREIMDEVYGHTIHY